MDRGAAFWGLPPAATRTRHFPGPCPTSSPAVLPSSPLSLPAFELSLLKLYSLWSIPQIPTYSSDTNSFYFPSFGELIPERSLGSSKRFGGYSRPSTKPPPKPPETYPFWKPQPNTPHGPCMVTNTGVPSPLSPYTVKLGLVTQGALPKFLFTPPSRNIRQHITPSRRDAGFPCW